MPSTPAVSDASTAALIPIGSKTANVPVIEIKRPVFLIGARKDAVKLHLDSSTVSKLHCAIVLNAWGCYVHDLGSRTGTLVNGQPVVDQDLNDGDEVQVGRFKFRFRAPKRTTPKPTPLPAADLVVSGLELPLTAHKRVLTIGRRAGSDVEFDDKSVSNLHAMIVEQDGRRLLRDLGSRTGTWIGDAPIHQEVLPDGAGFRVGRQVLTLTSRHLANELPLDEPIPLSEAPAPVEARPAAPGLITPGIVPTAGLGTLDLGAIDFDAVEDLDHAGPAAVPADDDLSLVPTEEPHAAPEDDLAALRRNWQTTPRPTDEIPPTLAPPLPNAPIIPPPATPALDPAARAPIPSIPHRPIVRTFVPPPPPPVIPPVAEIPLEPEPPLAPADEATIAPADEAAAEPVADLGLIDEPVAEAGPVPADVEPADADEAVAEADTADALALASETLDVDLPPPPADAPKLDVLAEAPAEPVDLADLEADPVVAEAEELARKSETLDLTLPPAPADVPDLEILDRLKRLSEGPKVIDPDDAAEAAAHDAIAIEQEPDEADTDEAVAELAPPAELATPADVASDRPADLGLPVPAAEAEAEVDELVLDPDAPAPLDLDALDLDELAPAAEARAETDADLDELLLDPDAPAIAGDEAEDAVAETPVPDRLAIPDELEPSDEPAAAVETTPVAGTTPAAVPTAEETVDAEAVADELILADGGEPTSPVAAAEIAAPVPDEAAPAAEAPADDLIELELTDLDADAAADEILVADGAAPAGPLVAEIPAGAEAGPAVPAAETDAETDLEPLDLADLELVLDPDAPATDGAIDLDAPWPDPDAPPRADAVPAAPAVAEAEPHSPALEDMAAAAETSTAGVAGPVSEAVVADLVPPASDEDGVPWPTEAAVEAATIDLAAPGDTAGTADELDLADDKDFTEAEPAAASAAILPADVDLSDAPSPAEAAAETVTDARPTADDLAATLGESEAVSDENALPPGEREVAGVMLDDAGLASAIGAEIDEAHALHHSVAPGLADDAVAKARQSPTIDEPPVEPDLVRIVDETDEDEDDATALAVDLGLVLDDDVAPSEAPPAEPVDVDLTAPRPGSVDRSRIGPAVSGPYGAPIAPPEEITDEGPAEDLFDADVVDAPAMPTAVPPAPIEPLKPAAEAPRPQPPKTDDLSGPMGGSLADLIPSGPPLLGGSFMSLPPMMPPVPSIPARQRPGQGQGPRPRRVGFGGEPPRPKRGPFSAQRTIADAIEPGSAVDDDEINLAPPPAPAATPAADAFSTPIARTPSLAPAPVDPNALATRPRGTIRPVLAAEATYASQPGTLATPVSVAMSSGPTEEELLDRAKLHKKRVRRVITCVLAMIVLVAGAAWGVLYFLPPKAQVDALINFDKLDRISPEERQLFRNRMNDQLTSESVRQEAILLKPAGVESGFLASPKLVFDAIDREAKIRWPDDRLTFMRLRVHSLDRSNDIERVRALATALAKTGDADRGKANELDAAVSELQRQIASYGDQIKSYSDQIQALEQATKGRPAAKDVSALNAEYFDAEKKLTELKSLRQELEATVERLKKPAVATPSTGPAIDPTAVDQELAALTKQLGEVQQTVIKPTPVATEERKKLDAAFKELEQQLAQVQGQKANPALVAYANKVSRGFNQVRDMAESLFRRQDGQRQQLAELKAKMSENLQALTQKKLEGDAELKKLRDTVGILTRKYNAAVASGEGELAKKAQLDLQIAKVQADETERKIQSEEDPVFTPAIQTLQQIIDRQETETRADRKNVDDRLAQLQADLLKESPDTGKLPADQKQLAENIQKKLTAMNDARRATAEAEDKALAEQAKAEAAATETAAALRTKIAARRADVLAAERARQAELDETTRRQRLADTQAELTRVRQQEQAAAHRLTDATNAIDVAERQKRIDAQSEADLKAKIAARDNIDRERRQANDALNAKQAALAKLIVPDRKVEVQWADETDRRPMVFATVAGTSVVLLLIPILLNLMALAREAQLPYASMVQEYEPDAEADEGFAPLMANEAAKAKQLPEPAHS